MTFRNPILGGGGSTLLRPAIQSPNYTPGISGWSVNRRGDAEFNDLMIRGTYMGDNYVFTEQGAFFYSGAPAAGNLTGSWAPAAGVDPYGNAYPAGLSVYNPEIGGHVLLDPQVGGLQLLDADGDSLALADGAVLFNRPGQASQASISKGYGSFPNALFLTSGSAAGADRKPELSLIPSDGAPVPGDQDTSPRIVTAERSANVIAHHYVSGAVVKCNPLGDVGETWQTPAYNANWTPSTTFNGITGWPELKYRLDAEDNVWLSGCFKTGSTPGGNMVFNMPDGYRPAKPGMIPIIRAAGGNVAVGFCQISGAGNLNVSQTIGAGSLANAEFYVNGKVPLGNLR